MHMPNHTGRTHDPHKCLREARFVRVLVVSGARKVEPLNKKSKPMTATQSTCKCAAKETNNDNETILMGITVQETKLPETKPMSQQTNNLTSGFLALSGVEGEPTPAIYVRGGSLARCRVRAEQIDDKTLRVTSNAVPNYVPYVAGVRIDGPGWANDKGLGDDNPGSVKDTQLDFTIKLADLTGTEAVHAAEGLTKAPMGAIGVAVNGVPFYNPFAAAVHTGAENTDAMRVEAFDSCCGHPSPAAYHYHQYPACLRLLGDAAESPPRAEEIVAQLQRAFAAREPSPLLGWMLDGYPVFGPLGHDAAGNFTLLRSSYTGAPDEYGNPTYVAGSGELDVCNGLKAVVPGFSEPIYHYVLPLVGHVTAEGELRISVTTQEERLRRWHGEQVTYSGPPLSICESAYPHTTVMMRGEAPVAENDPHGKGKGKGKGGFGGPGKGGFGKGEPGKGKGAEFGKGKGKGWGHAPGGFGPPRGPPPGGFGAPRGPPPSHGPPIGLAYHGHPAPPPTGYFGGPASCV